MVPRLVALGMVLVLVGGVCPTALFAAPMHHCCKQDSDCRAVRATMSCCTSQPGIPEAPASTASPASRTASTDAPMFVFAAHLALDGSPLAPAGCTADTHGYLSLPPLLRSCVARV